MDNVKAWFKSNKVVVIACIVFLFVGVACGWALRGKDLHNDGIGNATVDEQFERVGEYQSQAGKSIDAVGEGLADSIGRVDEAEARAVRIEDAVGSVTERNDESKELLTRSADIIRDSKQILATIREREETH